MKVKTTRFGMLEVPDDKVFVIKEGILGFPNETNFVILEHGTDGTPFKWLQSVDNPDLAFIVVDPSYVDPNYRFIFTEDIVEEFGSENQDDYALISIVNIPRDNQIKMTANLRAPIIVHLEAKQGRQTILPDEHYSLNQRIFSDTVGEILQHKRKGKKEASQQIKSLAAHSS